VANAITQKAITQKAITQSHAQSHAHEEMLLNKIGDRNINIAIAYFVIRI
jgi:hypothetical protein